MGKIINHPQTGLPCWEIGVGPIHSEPVETQEKSKPVAKKKSTEPKTPKAPKAPKEKPVVKVDNTKASTENESKDQ